MGLLKKPSLSLSLSLFYLPTFLRPFLQTTMGKTHSQAEAPTPITYETSYAYKGLYKEFDSTLYEPDYLLRFVLPEDDLTQFVAGTRIWWNKGEHDGAPPTWVGTTKRNNDYYPNRLLWEKCAKFIEVKYELKYTHQTQRLRQATVQRFLKMIKFKTGDDRITDFGEKYRKLIIENEDWSNWDSNDHERVTALLGSREEEEQRPVLNPTLSSEGGVSNAHTHPEITENKSTSSTEFLQEAIRRRLASGRKNRALMTRLHLDAQ